MVGFLNMSGHKMNGQHAPAPQDYPPREFTASTPLATYQPIAITANTIKWIIGGAIAALLAMPDGMIDRYVNPAKQKDMEALQVIVRTLQEGQHQIKTAQDNANRAVERLTLAVDNLAGIVESVKSAPRQAVQAVVPKAKR